MTPPDRTLIYLASFGERSFRDMAEVCVESLRDPGGYRGKVLVFTDNGFQPPDSGVEVARVSPPPDRLCLGAFKAEAAERISPRFYDTILTMDADMVAVGDIHPLFTHAPQSLSGWEERPWTRMSDPPCSACLTSAELLAARRRWGVNGGLLVLPSRLFRSVMRAWRREIFAHAARLSHWINQPALNALILRGVVPFHPLPRPWLDMPPMYFWRGGRFEVTRRTRMLHFCWPDKTQTVEEMAVFLHAARVEFGAGTTRLITVE